jgi:hypothetical protein
MGILNLFRRAAPPHDGIAATIEAASAIAGLGQAAPNGGYDPVDPQQLIPCLRSRAALALQRLVDRIGDAVAEQS